MTNPSSFVHRTERRVRCSQESAEPLQTARTRSVGRHGGWKFQDGDRLPDRLKLRSGEVRTTSVIFDLPKGAYEFVAGYGGGVHSGPSVASNSVAFDAPNGGNPAPQFAGVAHPASTFDS